jgi:hypothetical protein
VRVSAVLRETEERSPTTTGSRWRRLAEVRHIPQIRAALPRDKRQDHRPRARGASSHPAPGRPCAGTLRLGAAGPDGARQLHARRLPAAAAVLERQPVGAPVLVTQRCSGWNHSRNPRRLHPAAWSCCLDVRVLRRTGVDHQIGIGAVEIGVGAAASSARDSARRCGRSRCTPGARSIKRPLCGQRTSHGLWSKTSSLDTQNMTSLRLTALASTPSDLAGSNETASVAPRAGRLVVAKITK